MNRTTQHTNMQTAVNESCSSDQETESCCEPRQEMLFSYGDDSLTTASIRETEKDSRESTAPRSGTLERRRAANSYNKRMRLLMNAGLIKGITPTSVRMKSGEDCQEHVSCLLVGNMYDAADDEYAPKNTDC